MLRALRLFQSCSASVMVCARGVDLSRVVAARGTWVLRGGDVMDSFCMVVNICSDDGVNQPTFRLSVCTASGVCGDTTVMSERSEGDWLTVLSLRGGFLGFSC